MKRNNSPYSALLEMIMVTALIIIASAVLALAFGKAGVTSKNAKRLNEAVTHARNEMELLYDGTYDSDGIYVTKKDDEFFIKTTVTKDGLMMRAEVNVYELNEETDEPYSDPLYSLSGGCLNEDRMPLRGGKQ